MRAVIVIAALAAVASAQLPTDSQLEVVAPEGLHTQYLTGMVHSEALFGIPKYGRFVASRLFELGSNGCESFPANATWTEGGADAKPMLLIERGGCHFTTKVANAQQAGAAAVLIADDRPSCNNDPVSCPTALCGTCHNGVIPGANPNNCECFLPIMNDDGAHAIDIPSFLIPRKVANNLRSCMRGNAPCTTDDAVVLRMSWSLPAPDDRVEWSIWSTSTDNDAAQFRENFVSLVEPLGDTVQFTPNYFIYNGAAWGCTAPGLPCASQCTNQGRYCSPDPDHHLTDKVSGADVVQENLRQICVFRQANETVATDNGIRYWVYADLFYRNCQYPNWNAGCSQQQVEAAGLDWAMVAQCSSGAEVSDNTPNALLEEQITLRSDLFIVNLPSVVINGIIERGTISPRSVLQTICNGFSENRPVACQCSNVESNWLEVCVDQGLNAVPPEYGGTKGTTKTAMPSYATFLIVLLTLLVVAIAVGGFFAYRRVHANMRSMIEDYRRLDDHDDVGQSTQLTQL